MAAVARAGLQAKKAGGSVDDPSGARSFNTGGYKELLRGYVGEAATLISPEYQRRANQHVGGAAAFAAGFIPLVGTITGIYGAITGTDLFSGQQLGTTDRALGVAPFGRIAKALKAADVSVIDPTKLFKGHPIRGRSSTRQVIDLANEMKIKGWQGDPILVVHRNDGTLVVADGHHRLEAAKLAGLAEIPIKVVDDISELSHTGWKSLDEVKVGVVGANKLDRKMLEQAGLLPKQPYRGPR